MIRIVLFIIILNIPFNHLNAQSTDKWINFNSQDFISNITSNDSSLLIATYGGLVLFNKTSEDIKLYNKANSGIVSNEITSVTMDFSGKIWLGTRSEGICCLANNTCSLLNMENSQLPDNYIKTIKIDNNNNLWIGTRYCITKYDGRDWTTACFKQYLHYSSNGINDIVFDNDGVAWLATYWGLSRMDSLRLTEIEEVNSQLESSNHTGFKTSSKLNAIIFDKAGNLWIGSEYNGLLKYDITNNNIVQYNTDNSYIPSNTVYDIKMDSTESLWLATEEGLVYFNREQWIIYNQTNSALIANDVHRIEIDELNNIWGSHLTKEGLLKFKSANYRYYELNQTGLTSNYISTFAIDSNNNLWVTCVNQELIFFDGSNWYFKNDINELMKNFTYLSYNDSVRILHGNGIILNSHVKDQWNIYSTSNLHKGSPAQIDINGNIWLLHHHGLLKYDGSNWNNYQMNNSGLTSNSITDLNIDNNNNLWITTNCGGLVMYDCNNAWEIYDKFNSGLPDNSLNQIEIDTKQNKWMSVNHGGITVFNENGLSIASVNHKSKKNPNNFKLFQNYPNPFNPTTTITFSIPEASRVIANVYNIKGQKITEIVNRVHQTGNHAAKFSGINLPSGIYFVRVQMIPVENPLKPHVFTNKMMLIK